MAIQADIIDERSGDKGIDQLLSEIQRDLVRLGKVPETKEEWYQLGEVRGRQTIVKGEFGRVVRGVHKLTGLPVSIKLLPLVLLKCPKWSLRVHQETENQRVFHHPNIVQLLDVCYTPRNCMIVTEYLPGGSLLGVVRLKGRLCEAEARESFRQIVAAVAAMHKAGIAHRDLRMENVLIDSDGITVKLGGFGRSMRVKKGQKVVEQGGMPAYLAPETLLEKECDCFAVDRWSLGVMLYAMVTGTVPFRAHSLLDLHKVILRGAYLPPDGVSPSCKAVIKSLLQALPQNRPRLSQLLHYPWLYSGLPPLPTPLSPALDEFVLTQVESCGFPRRLVISAIRRKQANHASASYYLLLKAVQAAV